ncbi:MAG: hypothetical protein NUW01_02775 [Gemmatimonadaceae bacterium]|nr:hypothetical protein [Gemmatimonadaceae bacterium]
MATTDNRSLLELAKQYAGSGIGLKIRIQGVEPGFLMHNPESMRKQEEAAADWATSGKRTKFIPDPKAEAEWGAYRLENGDLYLPARMIHRCLVEAGKAFKVPKQRDSFMRYVAAGVIIPQAFGLGFPLLDPKTDEVLTSYEVDVQRVVIARASVRRARPLLEKWAANLQLDLDPETVPPEMFAQVIGYAGQRQGVGDGRPEKGGIYGRFTVVALEVA